MSNILVISDSPVVQGRIKGTLTANGYNDLYEANHGTQIIKMYEKRSYALVIVDLTMSSTDPVDELLQIRKTDPSTNIICCVKMGQHEIMSKVMNRYGVTDFLSVPLIEASILRSVRKAIG